MPPLYFSSCFYFGDFFFYKKHEQTHKKQDKDIILLQILYGLYVISIKP